MSKTSKNFTNKLTAAALLSLLLLISPIFMQLLWSGYNEALEKYIVSRGMSAFLIYILPILYGALAAVCFSLIISLPRRVRIIFAAIFLSFCVISVLPGIMIRGYLPENSGFPEFITGEANMSAYISRIYPLQLMETGAAAVLLIKSVVQKV